MPVRLSDDMVRMFTDKNFGHLATIMRDGSPQVTPVWVDWDGECILVNTAVGRLKQTNVERDPRVAISVVDSSNPYRRLSVRGRVTESKKEGAKEHISKLSLKYRGDPKYPLAPGEERIILRILPEKVTHH